MNTVRGHLVLSLLILLKNYKLKFLLFYLFIFLCSVLAIPEALLKWPLPVQECSQFHTINDNGCAVYGHYVCNSAES